MKTAYSAQGNISINRDVLYSLSRPAPLRLLFQTLFEWALIVGFIALGVWLSNALSILCILMISTRQHALLCLMHEYSHYQLTRRYKSLNDVIGDCLTALPFFITVYGFRRNHMPHHRSASTENDQNWISSLKKGRYQFPKKQKQIYIDILKHCLGWYTLADLRGYTFESGMSINLPRQVHLTRILWTAAILACTMWFDAWLLIFWYWIVPLATFLMAILYIRDMGEHFGMPSPGIAASRTVKVGIIERMLIAQNGVNFHTEHHLFPSVPFFRLSTLHEELSKNDTYKAAAVVTEGYLFGVIPEASCAQTQTVAAR